MYECNTCSKSVCACSYLLAVWEFTTWLIRVCPLTTGDLFQIQALPLHLA